jgi:hypothetical protein
MGDGHKAKTSHGGDHLSAVSIARQWIEQVRIILWSAGYLPSLAIFEQSSTFQGKPCNHLPAWRLVLSETDSARLLENSLDVEKIHWKKATWKQREITNVRALAYKGGAALRLAEVELLQYSGMIHNLHVEEDESFTVAGIAVHNSWFAREGARMSSKKVEYGRINTLSR